MTIRTTIAGVLAMLSLTACALLPGGKSGTPIKTYLLDVQVASADPAPEAGCHIVAVVTPEPAPGQSGGQMLYRRDPNLIERFAYSRWADSPANMLEPLLINALRATGLFEAVLSTPAPVAADLRIESEALRLIQIFDRDGSRVELHLEARILAPQKRRLLASRSFNYREAAAAATPVEGVRAANRAVARLLTDFSRFVVETGKQLPESCVEGD